MRATFKFTSLKKSFLFFSALFLSFSLLSHGKELPPEFPENGVIILPDMGKTPILSAIAKAGKSLDLALYHLDDPEIIEALGKAQNRGVRVRVLLNKPYLYPSPFETSINQETIHTLKENGVAFSFLPDYKYLLSHYKMMIVDGIYGFIHTFNYDAFNFEKARNFGIIIQNSEDIAALSQLFDYDFEGKPEENDKKVDQLREKNHLILGPLSQRQALIHFLKSAQKSIYIYQQDLSDPDIGGTLEELAKQGKEIYILMVPAPFGGLDNNRLNSTRIQAAGGHYKFFKKSDLYIHAKVVLLDPESDSPQMYVGSCNFWPEALSRNREIGIVLQDKKPIHTVFQVFQKDWSQAKSYEDAKANSN